MLRDKGSCRERELPECDKICRYYSSPWDVQIDNRGMGGDSLDTYCCTPCVGMCNMVKRFCVFTQVFIQAAVVE